MTRQRIRPSLKLSVFMDCPCCLGKGFVKSAESMSIEVVRKLMLAHDDSRVARVTIKVNEEVATYLNNEKRRVLSELEEKGEMTIQIRGSESAYPEHLTMECFNEKGDTIALEH